ncbi:hypothetical protein KCP73_07625 [Salmonella enterica subsp. enterica]|nr:hypothetical protein KCP73_07625 [Salmonella enterica subsp. enterica]
MLAATHLLGDCGYLSAVYDKKQAEKSAEKPEKNSRERSKWRVIYQDPRANCRGWGCAVVRKIPLADNATSWPNWRQNGDGDERLEQACGLFLKGEAFGAPVASPAYHIIEEEGQFTRRELCENTYR